MIIANLEEKNNTSDKLVMNKVKKKKKGKICYCYEERR